MSKPSLAAAATVLVLAVAASAPAAAQDVDYQPADIPVVGDQPSDYGTPAAAPAPAPGDAPGQPGAAEEEGFYIPSDEEEPLEDDAPRYEGDVPETHVVRKGDTLWDLCAYYFNDPWRWPKIWSYNPSITNPHWIYPGDLVRLFGAGERQSPMITRIAPSEAPEMAFDEPPPTTAVELRQLAFMDAEQLKFSGEISGSVEDKVLLTLGDEVYIDYKNGKPPQVSKRYAIYTPSEEVEHPEGGGKVGAYVILRGEVQILEVKKEKRARAMITYVTGTVERGYKVGPLKTQFKEIEPVANSKNLEGVIIALLDADALIGTGAVIFLDRGKDDGVKPGNTFTVVRRGDAYESDHSLPEGGRDDRRYPDESIGQVLVVDVGAKSAVALVTRSTKEAMIGDHVVMRKAK